MTSKSRALRGYGARDSGTHRKYNFNKSMARYRKSGAVVYRGKGNAAGSGHRAGEKWGEQKGIDPKSRIQKYGNNSPSFDEGVKLYKQRAKARALTDNDHYE